MNFYDYVNNFIANYDYVANSNKTLIRYCFTFKQIEPLFSKIIRNELNKELDILFGNPESFLKFEIAFYQSDKKLYSSHTYVFQKIASEYFGREVSKPSQVTIAANTLNFIELYSLKFELTDLLIQKLNIEYSKLTPLSQKGNFKLLRKTLIDSNYFHKSKNLDELIKVISNNIELSINQKSALRKLSSIKKKNIIIGKVLHDITNLYVLNNKIYIQYENILKNISNQTEQKKLISITKLIRKYFKIKPQAIELFKEHALDSFIVDNYNLLLNFKEYVTGRKFNLFTFILEIHLNKKLEYRLFNTKTLYFNLETLNTTKICLSKLYNKSKLFSLDFYVFCKNEIKNIKYENISELTLLSNIRTLNHIFSKYCDKDILDIYKLKFLSAENYKHFRSLKSKINSLYIEKNIKLSTKVHYFLALKWFCNKTNQKYINHYDEKMQANNYLEKRDLLKETYSLEEINKILKSLIEGIKYYRGNNTKLIVLCFALIQMVTGWNLSSLNSLKIQDIKPSDDNQNLYYINFIKRRANYQDQRHPLFKKTNDKTIYLLLYVRDKLRPEVLKNSKIPNFHTDFLFIFLDKFGMPRVSNNENIVRKINEILTTLGCNVSFNTQRMRKTVCNEEYKLTLKNFSYYKLLQYHNFEVFVRNYEKINITESNEKLINGIRSLENYLNRSDIILKEPQTNIDNIIEFTPIGNCHERKEDNKSPCSDYLACIFCKHFSVVNSEAQIYKLLDFKNVCITQMVNSSEQSDPNGNTKIAINEFKLRLDNILTMLKNSNEKLYNLAIINYSQNHYFSL